MDDKERYFWAGVIWVVIGFGGAIAISTVMGFFEKDVNFFLAFLMLGWVLFWVRSAKIMRLSHRVVDAIAKEAGKAEG